MNYSSFAINCNFVINCKNNDQYDVVIKSKLILKIKMPKMYCQKKVRVLTNGSFHEIVEFLCFDLQSFHRVSSVQG